MIPATSNIGVFALVSPIQHITSLAPAYDNVRVLASPPLLASRTQSDTLNASDNGSTRISVRVMRSMHSPAHISSRAQLRTDKTEAQDSVMTKLLKDQLKEMAREEEDKKTRHEEYQEEEGGHIRYSCRL
jgi:hypothetical protein